MSGSIRPFGAIGTGKGLPWTDAEGSRASARSTPRRAFALRAPVGAGSTIEASAQGGSTSVSIQRALLNDAEDVTLSVDTVPLQVHVVDPAGDGSIRIEMECSRFSGANAKVWLTQTVGPDVTSRGSAERVLLRVRFLDPDVMVERRAPSRSARTAATSPTSPTPRRSSTATRKRRSTRTESTRRSRPWGRIRRRQPRRGVRLPAGQRDDLPSNGQAADPRDPSTFLTVVGPDESTLLAVSTLDLADVAEPPEGVFLPAGLVSFTVGNIPVGSTQRSACTSPARPERQRLREVRPRYPDVVHAAARPGGVRH